MTDTNVVDLPARWLDSWADSLTPDEIADWCDRDDVIAEQQEAIRYGHEHHDLY